MGFSGADTDEVRALARQFGAEAARIDSDRKQIGRLVYSSGWDGSDADRFRADWTHWLSATLASAANFLRDAESRLMTEAAAQDEASGGFGGRTDFMDGAVQMPHEMRLPYLEELRREFTGDGRNLAGERYSSGNASAYWSAGTNAHVGADSYSNDYGHGFSAGAGTEHAIRGGMTSSEDIGIGTLEGGVDGFAGARVDAGIAGSYENGQYNATAGAGGFVGAEASMSGGVDTDVADVEASAGVRVGVGAEARGDVSVGMDEVAFSVDVGATLGLGFGVSVDVSVSPRETWDKFSKLF